MSIPTRRIEWPFSLPLLILTSTAKLRRTRTILPSTILQCDCGRPTCIVLASSSAVLCGDMVTFHPFPRLPYELRVHIWEMTVEPRVVEVRCDRPVPTRQQCYLTTSTPVPAVLQTCQEARDHGMYKKCFSEIAVPGYGAQYVAILYSEILCMLSGDVNV